MSTPIPLALSLAGHKSKRLEPIRVCARIIAELPPYLSCLGRREP